MAHSFHNQPQVAEESQDSNFPAWFYGPNGEAEIFSCEEDIPKGWKDTPSKTSQKTNGVAAEVVSEGASASENSSAAAHGDLTLEEIKSGLANKSMSELWKTAKELELPKDGKKPELIERIAVKLLTSNE